MTALTPWLQPQLGFMYAIIVGLSMLLKTLQKQFAIIGLFGKYFLNKWRVEYS